MGIQPLADLSAQATVVLNVCTAAISITGTLAATAFGGRLTERREQSARARQASGLLAAALDEMRAAAGILEAVAGGLSPAIGCDITLETYLENRTRIAELASEATVRALAQGAEEVRRAMVLVSQDHLTGPASTEAARRVRTAIAATEAARSAT